MVEKIEFWNASLNGTQENLQLSINDFTQISSLSVAALKQRTNDELFLLNQDVKTLYQNIVRILELANQQVEEDNAINRILINRATKKWKIMKDYLEKTFDNILIM